MRINARGASAGPFAPANVAVDARLRALGCDDRSPGDTSTHLNVWRDTGVPLATRASEVSVHTSWEAEFHLGNPVWQSK
jgi:hypothetical protein